jgi:anti-sigma-K factor RskA
MRPHEQIKDDLSLYVLGALPADEGAEIATHLAECDECRGEARQWHEVVDMLPLAEQVRAPAELRAELLRRIAGGAAAALAASPVVVAKRRQQADVVPLRRWWPIAALAAAASIALAFGIVRERNLRRDLVAERQATAQLRAALAEAAALAGRGDAELKRARDLLAQQEQHIASLRTALGQAEGALALLRQPGLNLVRLKQAPDARPAEGHVLITTGGKALFYAFDLAPLPPDKVYELWWITEKEGPINAGLFRPDPTGIGQVETTVPTTAGVVKAAAVTVEPHGGVPKPTGPMVLLGDV